MKKKTDRNRKTTDKTAEDIAPVSRIQKLHGMFDIPPSAMGGIPQIELAGNREAVVEGCQGVLEYDENVIKLAAGKMSIKFTGRGLQIKVLTHDSAVIEGFIASMEFIV